MTFMTSLPVVAGCSCISTDTPFHWARQGWLLHPLSSGRVPLTMIVASAGPSQFSPNSSRTQDQDTVGWAQPSRWCVGDDSFPRPAGHAPPNVHQPRFTFFQWELTVILSFNLVPTVTPRSFPEPVGLIVMENEWIRLA